MTDKSLLIEHAWLIDQHEGTMEPDSCAYCREIQAIGMATAQFLELAQPQPPKD